MTEKSQICSTGQQGFQTRLHVCCIDTLNTDPPSVGCQPSPEGNVGERVLPKGTIVNSDGSRDGDPLLHSLTWGKKNDSKIS